MPEPVGRIGTRANLFVEGERNSLDEHERQMIARRDSLLGPAYRLFYREPLHLVEGNGVWVYDSRGKRYLDAYNNVVAVGHCHPRVVKALVQQAATLNTHTRYLHEGILDYSERLLQTFPEALGRVMFTCTGSEANDLAVRVSKAFTGGTGFIVTQWAYHGVTDSVAQLSPSLGVPLGDAVRIVSIPRGLSSSRSSQQFAEDVRRAIDELQAAGLKIAALVCDTIFSSEGVFTDPAGFLRQAVVAVRDVGGVFIADEVQAGFGRTGDAMWGFARHGLVPDLVSLGKPMGNGHPIGGLVVRPEIIEEFGKRVRYFNTFGGNPVSCAAASATLQVIQEDELVPHVQRVGTHLINGLRHLAKAYPVIKEVRGAGLAIGVEIVREDGATPDSASAADIVNDMRHRGVLISATGPHANVLKIRPPLIITQEQVDQLLDMLEQTLRIQRK